MNIKDNKLSTESIEANSSNIYGGNYDIVLYVGDVGTISANVEIENDIDYDDFQVHWVEVNKFEVLNDNDEIVTDHQIDSKSIAEFIQNDQVVYNYIEDMLQGIAESSRLEAQLSNLESRQRDIYFNLK
jgi:hypothetical protein|tara:strand:+ start:269 stop:655 length:387 start_codon:yes stop_codon:yes gene_type:complete